MIRCIIVEDEVLAQDVIKNHLEQVGGFELVGVFRNGPSAMESLNKQDIDVLFLDIRLPGMTGLHFLSTLTDPPLVILTTAYAEYALESYEFSVIDYLLKPISLDRFSKAVSKIEGRLFSQTKKDQETLAPPKDHFFIKSNNKFFKVRFSEIFYISGLKDYLKIHTAGYTLVTHQTLNEMEKLLPADQFVRVHRSYIVAIAQIQAVSGNSIEMKFPSGQRVGQSVIPIGVSYKDTVKDLLF